MLPRRADRGCGEGGTACAGSLNIGRRGSARQEVGEVTDTPKTGGREEKGGGGKEEGVSEGHVGSLPPHADISQQRYTGITEYDPKWRCNACG